MMLHVNLQMYGTGTETQWWLDATGGHAFSRDGWEMFRAMVIIFPDSVSVIPILTSVPLTILLGGEGLFREVIILFLDAVTVVVVLIALPGSSFLDGMIPSQLGLLLICVVLFSPLEFGPAS